MGLQIFLPTLEIQPVMSCYCVDIQRSLFLDYSSVSVGEKNTPVSLSLLYLCLWQKGTYLPQTYIIHEEMVVTGKVHNMRQLGPFIYRLCNGKDTYRLNRRITHRRKLQGSMEIFF